MYMQRVAISERVSAFKVDTQHLERDDEDDGGNEARGLFAALTQRSPALNHVTPRCAVQRWPSRLTFTESILSSNAV
ncbi:uncharacterized [Tachysurus ichikawai]